MTVYARCQFRVGNKNEAPAEHFQLYFKMHHARVARRREICSVSALSHLRLGTSLFHHVLNITQGATHILMRAIG